MVQRAAVAAAAVLFAAVLVTAAMTHPGPSSGPTSGSLPSGSLPGGTAVGSGGSSSSGSPSPYTFDDEFDGSSVGSTWQRHFSCCGDLAGYDPSLSTVANGILTMRVSRHPEG